jgi:iron-sulfur cluster repair protein YtfE (RIC family)
MKDSIESLMMREHADIHYLLCAFDSELDASAKTPKEKFNGFKWALEKHFFVEEKAIFQISDKIVGERVTDIFDLMKEHGEILEVVKNIEEAVEQNMKPDIADLKARLLKHARFEDVVFYPKLDELLDENKKKEIIEKIKEIVRS